VSDNVEKRFKTGDDDDDDVIREEKISLEKAYLFKTHVKVLHCFDFLRKAPPMLTKRH
jgi:hypothetical protein